MTEFSFCSELTFYILYAHENLRSWEIEDLLRVTAVYLVGDGIQLAVCSLWNDTNSHIIYTRFKSDRWKTPYVWIKNQLQNKNTLHAKCKGQRHFFFTFHSLMNKQD